MEFVGFPKMARLNKDMIITEKIDGTNAQLVITEDGEIHAASRTRYITPEKDNYGFAAWVRDNKEELLMLGVGRHFGEWWGQGIQRRYNMDHKVLSLFNVQRWVGNVDLPSCCRVVPILYTGPFDTKMITTVFDKLLLWGSVAAPNYMNPEGIIITYTGNNVSFKKTQGDFHKGIGVPTDA